MNLVEGEMLKWRKKHFVDVDLFWNFLKLDMTTD